MRKPSKPKMLKTRRKPKTTSPLATWEKYDAHVKEVEKENKKRTAEYKKYLGKYEAEKKKKESLISKHR